MNLTYENAMYAAARKYLVDTLNEAHWNVKLAAVHAGLNRTHLYELMERYDIERPNPCHCKGAHRGQWEREAA